MRKSKEILSSNKNFQIFPGIPQPNNKLRVLNLTYLIKSNKPRTSTVSHFTKPLTSDKINVKFNETHRISKISSNQNCGIPKVHLEIRSLIFGGESIKRGEWPWLVAIYLANPLGISFACGGNLISPKAVITAAHCVKTPNKLYKPREVLLYYGHHNRRDWTETDSIRRHAAKIIIHPDYEKQTSTKDADLAILLIESNIKFNDFIQPICLWKSKNDDGGSDDKGTVVGWGRDSFDRSASTVPKKIELPIVENSQCIETSPAIATALSDRTFCAGTLNGDGPCHGDSGI